MIRTSADKREKPICLMVLGPHRCGTSSLSGMLSSLGADLPATLMPASPGNELGYFESDRVARFNDKLLFSLGTDWKDLAPLDPEAIPAQVFDSFLSEAVSILKEEFAGAKLPVLKDPRICRLARFWTEAFSELGYSAVYVHTHRNPLETAQSLNRRDNIPTESGVLIWLRHVLDAEAATRGQRRAFTNYGALLRDWREEVKRLELALELKFHRNTIKTGEEIDHFLRDDLRHQKFSAEDVRISTQVSDVLRDTFWIVERWSRDGEDARDYGTLDALRQRLDGSLGQIAIFARALNEQNKLAEQSQSLRLAVEGQLAQKADENARLEARLNDLTEKDAASQHRLAQCEEAVSRLQLEADQRLEEKSGLSARIADLTAEKERIEAEKERVEAELEESQSALLTSIRGREVDVRRLEKTVAERFRETADLTRMLLDARQKSETLQQEVRKLKADAERLTQNWMGEYARAEAILSSTSWKITAPLRRLVNLMRSGRS